MSFFNIFCQLFDDISLKKYIFDTIIFKCTAFIGVPAYLMEPATKSPFVVNVGSIYLCMYARKKLSFGPLGAPRKYGLERPCPSNWSSKIEPILNIVQFCLAPLAQKHVFVLEYVINLC